MRPVNLIPPEDRRGDRAPLRSGPLSYVIVGALAVVLLAVTLLVTTKNGIADKESQVEQLNADLDAATAEAGNLAPFTEFAALRTDREATIASLAQSRFDWERVMRELAVVIPEDVTLTNLNGSAVVNAEGSASTAEIGAPNLTISGCASDHTAVATFVAALEDIDGVTRVGLARTETPEGEAGSDSTLGGSTLCGSANTFDLSVAFDNAAVSPAAADAAAPPAAPAAQQVSVDPDAQSQAGQENSQEEQTSKAKKAANLVPGSVTP
ncbi:MAG TPA: PilN domain-containing protein [Solirubrobacterales bacterium]|nr:PilN domain-containing protein [Solirubrobacterales bacterium]